MESKDTVGPYLIKYVDFDVPPWNWNWVLDCVQTHQTCMSLKKSYSDMGTLELELGIGLAHSLASMLILMAPLGIGIGYWIGSKFIKHVCLSKTIFF